MPPHRKKHCAGSGAARKIARKMNTLQRPKARRAAWLASSGGRPLSRCSSSSNSRSDLSSRSKSVSLLWSCHHHFMSTLLCGRPHHPCNSFRHLLPLRLLDNKLLLAFVRQSVIFEFPVSIRSRFPFGNDPAFSL